MSEKSRKLRAVFNYKEKKIKKNLNQKNKSMYTFSEIKQIFDNCSTWQELEEVSAIFGFLFKENWIKSKTAYNCIVQLCDAAFRRLENI